MLIEYVAEVSPLLKS